MIATRTSRVLVVAILIGIILRVVALDRLPGMNGDEAWYGVNVQIYLDGGEPFTHTPGTNPLNLFHSAPLLLFSYVFEPSFALLRVPSVLLGILAIVLAYPLLANPLGARTAAGVTLLIALSPVAVAYARFGWDPSGTPLFSLLAVGAALRNRPLWALLAWLLALRIHPTNVFLAPIVAAAWAPHAIDWYRAQPDVKRYRVHRALVTMGVLAAAVAFWGLKAAAANPGTLLPSIAMVIERVFSVSGWIELAANTLRLFAGVTTTIFIAGPISDVFQRTAIAAVALGLLAPMAVGWREFASEKRRQGPWLLAGIAVSLAVFQVVAGPTALEPGRERYALFVVVPLLLLCAVGVDALARTTRFWAAACLTLVCVCFATIVGAGYFIPLATRGGDSEQAFRTGVVEPKAAAFQFIASDSAEADVIELITEDYWLYWPTRYLAGSDRRFHVELLHGANALGGLRPAGVEPTPYPHAPDKVYEVVFEAGTEWQRLKGLGLTAAFTAHDPIGRPILHVVALPGSAVPRVIEQ